MRRYFDGYLQSIQQLDLIQGLNLKQLELLTYLYLKSETEYVTYVLFLTYANHLYYSDNYSRVIIIL